MAERTFHPGTFVWRELMTDDVEGARRFYSGLFGWSFKGEDMGPAGTYWMASRDGRQIGGVMAKPAGAPMPTAWSSYVLVEDVDAAARRCTSEGGRVLRDPADIEGVGRFAVIADPWGAVLLPFRGSSTEEAPSRPGLGAFCWETLVTPNPASAAAFYRKVIGFGAGRTPSGEGTVFTAGGAQVADVQPASGGPSYWATYVAVADAVASRDLAERLGGKVITPRIDIPRVGIVAVVADPGGGALGLFQAA